MKNLVRDNYSEMHNPVNSNFDWGSLYQRYDNTCRRFDPDSPYLYGLTEKAKNDRYLYYSLADKTYKERKIKVAIELGTYEAILYWKLYSQPAATKNVCAIIRNDGGIQEKIDKALKELGEQLAIIKVTEDINSIINLYNLLDNHGRNLFGLNYSCALPAMTTLLHFFILTSSRYLTSKFSEQLELMKRMQIEGGAAFISTSNLHGESLKSQIFLRIGRNLR